MSDHEVVRVGGHLIPILGVANGTPAQSRETARNIENFLARGLAAQEAADREIARATRRLKKRASEKRRGAA